MSFDDIPNHPLCIILKYIGKPEAYLSTLEVCTQWRDRFDLRDGELWMILAADQNITINSPKLRRSHRSTSNHKKVFLKAYFDHQNQLKDKHEHLIQQANVILSNKKDTPAKLQALIKRTFQSKLSDFNVNWQSVTMENNSLITLAARRTHLKCIRLIVEYYKSDINLCDVGGFTPLILCAYHGVLSCVIYCLKNGANINAQGRLRSGQCLTAEHWAAVQGHQEVFLYLRAMRLRSESRAKNLISAPLTVYRNGTDVFGSIISGSSSSSSSSSSSIGGDNNGSVISGNSSIKKVKPGWSGLLCATAMSTSTHCTDANLLREILQEDRLPSSNSSSSSSSSSTGSTNTGGAQTSFGETFCICGKGFVGAMVACEAPGCPVEWFHFECVGLSQEPAGDWVCAACKGERFTQPLALRVKPLNVVSPVKRSGGKRGRGTGAPRPGSSVPANEETHSALSAVAEVAEFNPHQEQEERDKRSEVQSHQRPSSMASGSSGGDVSHLLEGGEVVHSSVAQLQPSHSSHLSRPSQCCLPPFDSVFGGEEP